MAATTPQPSNSGIITDKEGQRHIPESTRADGSTRKAIRIRPGYRPPEDVELYKNSTAEAFRTRGKSGGIPGADGLKESSSNAVTPASAASNKNAKRREARKRAKAADEVKGTDENAPADDAKADEDSAPAVVAAAAEVDPDVEKKKKIRSLKKKLDQARTLREKKEGGESLLPEQIAKVIKISELTRELEALGFDGSGGETEKSEQPTAP